jgi:phosphate transport system permease protein
VLSITVKTAAPGIITGCMLAFARVAGETAPLIFYGLRQFQLERCSQQPISALPLEIYRYATFSLRRPAPAGVGSGAGIGGADCGGVSLVRYVTSRGVLKGAS